MVFNGGNAMLEKETYSQLFKWSFSKKTQVTYWDGTVKEYGQGSGDQLGLKESAFLKGGFK